MALLEGAQFLERQNVLQGIMGIAPGADLLEYFGRERLGADDVHVRKMSDVWLASSTSSWENGDDRKMTVNTWKLYM